LQFSFIWIASNHNKCHFNALQEVRVRKGGHLPRPAVWAYSSIIRDVSGSPEPSLTISFIRKESFQPDLKGREGVCFLKPNWQLVPQRGA